MASLRRIGFDDVNGRALLLLEAEHASDVPSHFLVGSEHFVALIVLDATTVETQQISRVARILLDAGCVYFCCWGLDCERVHDIIDDEYLAGGRSISDDASTIMTTWHNDEPLEEAAWFALNVAFPDDRFFETANAVVAVVIGNAGWSREIEVALSDPLALVRRVVGDGDPRPNHALYTDAPGRHGLCIDRKGRAGSRRAGKRNR